MPMVNIEDHQTPEGKTNQKSYRAAQIANGEICTQCGEYARVFGTGHPELCSQCKDADKTEELTHDVYIRCPKCGYKWNAYEDDEYTILSDGEHTVSCHQCDYEFGIVTNVSYSFVSPERQPRSESQGE